MTRKRKDPDGNMAMSACLGACVDVWFVETSYLPCERMNVHTTTILIVTHDVDVTTLVNGL